MIKKLFSSIVAVMLVIATVAPTAASAETLVGNQGNGVDTSNNTSVNTSNSTTVSQSNSSTINNNISVKSSTGGNNASRNTGGDVTVESGKAQTTVEIENVANSNAAQVNTCCQAANDVTVVNQGNGDSSSNKAQVNNENSTGLFQTNVAEFNNNVNVDSNTGKNKAEKNTGGDTTLYTGASLVGLDITNTANENRAVLGRSTSASNGSDVTLSNSGNGVDTHNKVSANFENTSTALQTNGASINNNVGVRSNTGYNQAGRNTGGDVLVESGASAVLAALDNRANFNAATLDNCGCVGFGDTKVVNNGNGDSAYSRSSLNRENESEIFQANASEINNSARFEDNTGKNKADKNTGTYGYNSDPELSSGNALVDVSAQTSANENLLNSGAVSMPTAPTTGGNTSGNASWWMSWGAWNWMF